MPLAETKNGPLHYEIVDQVAGWNSASSYAERPTILFHHGIGGCAGMWAGWLPKLIDGYRIVKWDMRGYGRSATTGFDWSLDLLVSDVFAVADAAGAARFHLVGESIGGTIAMAAVLARPERIAGLLLLAPAPDFTEALIWQALPEETQTLGIAVITAFASAPLINKLTVLSTQLLEPLIFVSEKCSSISFKNKLRSDFI